MLESCRLWAGWDLDWSVPVADLDGVPRVEDNKLVLKLRKVSDSPNRGYLGYRYLIWKAFYLVRRAGKLDL